ncbi:uncharacterized protein [Haliotis asinina]|uniref:uncharacterized protein isoform X2 n=1 Tax=Haliotis asinina TaxID=109174 RepID=UPI003531B7DE
MYSPPTDCSDVSCWWRITAFSPDRTVCVIVQFPKMSSIRNCMVMYVDVHDGYDSDAPILGRWCDMDSSLLRTSGNQAFVFSRTQYNVQFKFDVWYGTKDFSLDEMSTVSPEVDAASSMSTGVKLGIGVSVLMAVVLLSVAARYLIRILCSDRSENTRRQAPSVSSGAESNPPDYWSVVVSPSREAVAVHVAGNQPPAYWDVVTVGDLNNGLPLPEDRSVLSVQEDNRATALQENHSAMSIQEDQGALFQQNRNVIPDEVSSEIALSEDYSEITSSEDRSVAALSQDHNEITLSQEHRETILPPDHV